MPFQLSVGYIMDPDRPGYTKVSRVFESKEAKSFDLRDAVDARRLMGRINTALETVEAHLAYNYQDSARDRVRVTGVTLNGKSFDLNTNSDTRKFVAEVNTLLDG